MKWVAGLIALSTPFIAVALAKPSCFVIQAVGDIRYRAANTLNWRNLEERKKLYPGDLVFTRQGASMRLEYIFAGASVQLPPQTLFRIGDRPPTYTKLRRRFGIEKSGSAKSEKDQSKSPFERVNVRKGELAESDKSEKKSGNTLPTQQTVMRETTEIRVATPKSNSSVIAAKYPTTLALRVNQEFMGQKIWAFVWSENDRLTPIWRGYSQGEFAGIVIPTPGAYEVQVMSDDESMISEPITVKFTDTATALPDILDKLRDKRDSDQTIMLE